MTEDLEARFFVVCNHEEQYALWPAFKPVPEGWGMVKEEDSWENCLSYVNQHWVDIRPKSLRSA